MVSSAVKTNPVKLLIRDASDGVPYLLFRCWDESSHGTNSDTGFAGGLAVHGPPLLESDPDLLAHAEAHLWGRAQSSPFVSLTTSLPTALRKAAHKIAAGGSPIVTVLDARSVALNTRLYHARELISTLRRRNVRLPYYGGHGEFEYMAWQNANSIVGQVDLVHMRQWILNDAYLGALLVKNDLGNMGVAKFRDQCHNAIPLHGDLGRSIGSLARLFRPTTSPHDPFLKDFTRLVLQNFNLVDDLNNWENNKDFTNGLFATSVVNTIASVPQQVLASVNDYEHDDHASDEFEDIEDALQDDANDDELNSAVGQFEDTDHGAEAKPNPMLEHNASCGTRLQARLQSFLRKPTTETPKTPERPLAHRGRASSSSPDEVTISLPPSPYDTMRAQMRIAAQQASPTPAPRRFRTEEEDLEDVAPVPRSAATAPTPSVDREAAMQQMVSVVPPAERGRWTLAFDMYVRGIVMDVMAEGSSI